MSITICTKCRGPVVVEDGRYVCALCNENYGTAEEPVSEEFIQFFEKTPLAKLQEIGRHFHELVAMNCYVGGKKEDPRAIHIIAPLSNGQYFTRFIPGNGYNSIYRGQCAVENWYATKSIYASEEFTVAIAEDGTLQPTLIEVDQAFQRIKKSGLSDMRMKQIVDLNYQHSYQMPSLNMSGTIEDQFMGLDVNGKVIIYNPFEVFELDAEDEEEREKCAKLMQHIKSWPAIDKLYYEYGFLLGVTESGNVFAVPTSSYATKSDEKLAKTLSKWDNIESIVSVDETVFFGLKKDGTLISNAPNSRTERYLPQDIFALHEIVQIECHGYNFSKLIYLTRQGELYIHTDKIDDHVISILSRGYVRADGSMYELVSEGPRNTYAPIPNLKLFNSIETLEEEVAETVKGFLTWRSKLSEERLVVSNNLQAKRSELSALNNQYSQLGLFKAKEKKALHPLIDALSQEVKKLESEISRIDEAHRSIPTGKPTWHSIDTSGGQTYSINQMNAAAHQAISGKSSEASVLGSAAVGAIVAGPAGAIVGAIYAANKNNKKK